MADCGFNRVSMGVQDFDPHVQQTVHRIQPFEDTRNLVERCRSADLGAINLDLIYGLPEQSVDSFSRTLDAVFEIRPERLALYSYAHVTWVAKQQRGFERRDLPDAATKLRIFLTAIRRFLEAGYVYVGMDHFALPDDELSQALRDRTLRRNFMGYTTRAGLELLGFGPSAITELPRSYAQSERDVDAWEEAVGRTEVATIRGHRLTDDDVERRFVIWRIMCHGEVVADDYRERFGRSFADSYGRELELLAPFQEDGLVQIAPDGSLALSLVGRLMVRNVAAVFDAYLPEQERADRPLFSQSL
jgi:oxygen-independent coproporphyrinogen-3 oxidase